MVGGGLAGLACATRLHKRGVNFLIVEGSDTLGGRVRTDCVDGFLLDHGFQVYLSAYPEAGKLLNLESLGLRKFRPGALVFKGGKFRRLMDVFRCPGHAFGTAMQPIGTIKDKLLVGKLRLAAKRFTDVNIGEHQERTTESYLRDYGFSESMIDTFFRAFYGGIFLERDLRTSSRMFQFTFKMFADGFATLPAKGMQCIPNQLAERLPTEAIRLGSRVRAVGQHTVTMETGEILDADAVVVATDSETAKVLVPSLDRKKLAWRSVIGMNFVANHSPLGEPIIALNGNNEGLVNNVCVLSDVSPHYAPKGKSLISVSVLGNNQEDNLVDQVREELLTWFGTTVRDWRHLRSYSIRKALPEQGPTFGASKAVHEQHAGIYFCGDYLSAASIEGAIRSGNSCAESILNSQEFIS
ncbi:MAG: NAD(P)/FAD-dependent oxidoreductase [Verrucomicrobiales bacterium]|nr:FAD-dependent oxidoreductase [Verrucomicrobiales bacterium]MDF1787469.1 NAD(P)/FAD-dependent oxidoreductase [Verrucomicrobiales bacterium]